MWFSFQGFDIADDYCGLHDFNKPVDGSKPIQASAVARFRNTLVTSIAVAETTGYTVAFLGTANGAIKKVGILFYQRYIQRTFL